MISITDLQLTYRSSGAVHHALKGVSLAVPRGALLTLLGPSGCGKTTLLRSIAGLETPDHGTILIDGEPVFSTAENIDVPSARRNLGMVFQSYAIWPHMSVYQNAAFPLRYQRRLPRRQTRDRVMQCLALVQLDALADRPAPMLSGGQQQRLALARALVAEPKVLLLDEPLSNLDARLREDMRFELRQIIQRTGVTTIFVTHEQTEALSMSDIVAVMNDGEIIQSGEPRGLYLHPRSEFVANFLVRSNLLPGRVLGGAPGHVTVATPIGDIACIASGDIEAGADVTVVLKPETVSLSAAKSPLGVVEAVAFMGDAIECIVRVGETRVIARLPGSSPFDVGDGVDLAIEAGKNAVFASKQGKAFFFDKKKQKTF